MAFLLVLFILALLTIGCGGLALMTRKRKAARGLWIATGILGGLTLVGLYFLLKVFAVFSI